jgi:hypothetical protein
MSFKKTAFLLIVVIFAFWILGVSVVKTSAVESQTNSRNYKVVGVEPQPSNEEIVLVATEAAKKEVDYFLVYPGILPDHFMYPVKMLRDRLQLWLTTNFLKKGELVLKYADKRLGAGRALIEGNKIELGISTLTKAEKYLQQAVDQEKLAREKGENTRIFLDKLSKASLKHQEVLLVLKEKVAVDFRPEIEKALELLQQSQQRIKQAWLE